MHNLALALHHKGYEVSGSDDAIFEPSKSRLAKYDLLPVEMGWFPEKIDDQLDDQNDDPIDDQRRNLIYQRIKYQI